MNNKVTKPKKKFKAKSKIVSEPDSPAVFLKAPGPEVTPITAIPPTLISQELPPLQYALWQSDPKSEVVTIPSAGLRTVSTDARKTAAGKYIAMDCEFVGVGRDKDSALARVSIVNFFGVQLLDIYVKPDMPVTDFRTWVSGIEPHHMTSACSFRDAQKRVHEIIDDKILVGHAVHNDLRVLQINHPKPLTRDTSRFSEFRKLTKGKPPSLKKMADVFLGAEIHTGQHSSVVDARVTMALFRSFKKAIERECNRYS